MRLSDLYPDLTGEQRRKLAHDADTTPEYLYQLATRWRDKKPSLKLMMALARADARLSVSDMAAEFDEVSSSKAA